MTEDTSKELTPELAAWIGTWKAALQQTLSQISGQAVSLEISTELLPAAESDLWYLVTAGGGARGEMTFRLPSSIGVRLAQMLMGEPESRGERSDGRAQRSSGGTPAPGFRIGCDRARFVRG